MKRNKILLQLSLVTLFTVTGCGPDTTDKIVSRTDAINTLETIKTARENSSFKHEYDSFTVSKIKVVNKTARKNNVTASKVGADNNSIDDTFTSLETGVKETYSNTYRYSEKHKYISTYEIDSETKKSNKIIYFIKAFDADTKEYLYGLNVNTKEYVKIENNINEVFKNYLNAVKEKSEAIINAYSDISTAKNYFSSLPETLNKENEEEYRKRNENSIYLRATGNEGTPVTTEGTQDTYLTRFVDNVCVSSYLHTNDGIKVEVTTPENFKFQGGHVAYCPVVENTFTVKLKADDDSETVEYKDDGNGGLVDAEGNALSSAYIDYTTGQFYIAAAECKSLRATYSYKKANEISESYAAEFKDFVNPPSDIPLSLDSESGYTKVAAL